MHFSEDVYMFEPTAAYIIIRLELLPYCHLPLIKITNLNAKLEHIFHYTQK